MRLGRLPISGACSNVENSPKVPVTRPYSKAIFVTGDSFKVARYIGTRGEKVQTIALHPCICLSGCNSADSSHASLYANRSLKIVDRR